MRSARAGSRAAVARSASPPVPPTRIAAQVGFGSPTAFRDRFKKTTGVSPHSYRRAFG
ncbi:helix-turn-helix domain-containing protein [Actinomadura nitritigenes]